MTGDGRIRRVRKTKFLESRSSRNGYLFKLNRGKKSAQHELQNFLARDLNLRRTTNQFRSAGRDMNRCFLRSIIAQKCLFDLPAASYQRPPLPRRQCPISTHLFFDVMSDRQVDIVAAEDE